MQYDTHRWPEVEEFMAKRFERGVDLKGILFIIGLREMGNQRRVEVSEGQAKKKYTKEEKQDLMNLALCQATSLDGYFEITHLDEAGWPVWRQIKPMPPMDNKVQEEFIRHYVIRYFESEALI